MSIPLRIGLADDHALFIESLRHVLESRPELEIAFATTDLEQVTLLIQASRCDVLIADLYMARPIITELSTWAALTRVVVVTASERPEDALAALRAGAGSIVLKRFDLQELLSAIDAVCKGEVWISPALQEEVLTRQRRVAMTGLTTREIEITALVAHGLRNAEIAQSLCITEGTVKVHLNHIYSKLGVRGRVQLTLYAARLGLTAGANSSGYIGRTPDGNRTQTPTTLRLS